MNPFVPGSADDARNNGAHAVRPFLSTPSFSARSVSRVLYANLLLLAFVQTRGDVRTAHRSRAVNATDLQPQVVARTLLRVEDGWHSVTPNGVTKISRRKTRHSDDLHLEFANRRLSTRSRCKWQMAYSEAVFSFDSLRLLRAPHSERFDFECVLSHLSSDSSCGEALARGGVRNTCTVHNRHSHAGLLPHGSSICIQPPAAAADLRCHNQSGE